MFNVKTFLTNKFCNFQKENHFLGQLRLTKLSEKLFLNVIFQPIPTRYISLLTRDKDYYFPKEYIEMLKEYNGFTLFCHSILLYGMNQTEVRGYKITDIVEYNMLIRSKYPNFPTDYLALGRFKAYEFCIKKNDDSGNIYIINLFDGKKYCYFRNLNECIEYCVRKAADLYNEEGYLKQPLDEELTPLTNRYPEDPFKHLQNK